MPVTDLSEEGLLIIKAGRNHLKTNQTHFKLSSLMWYRFNLLSVQEDTKFFSGKSLEERLLEFIFYKFTPNKKDAHSS